MNHDLSIDQGEEEIAAIREVRHQISEQFDHDPYRLVAHLMELQKAHPEKLVPAPRNRARGESCRQVATPPFREPLRESEVMTRPVPLETPQPRYTKSARRVGIEGTVIMEVVIDEKGRVTDSRVLRSLPMGLDRMAVEAVRSWRFKPATLNGKPVKVYHSLVVDFNLKR